MRAPRAGASAAVFARALAAALCALALSPPCAAAPELLRGGSGGGGGAAAAAAAAPSPPPAPPALLAPPAAPALRDLPGGNGTSIVVDGRVLPLWAGTAFSSVLLAVGAGEVVLGYRLFRVTLFIIGATGGGVPTFLILWDQLTDVNAVWIALGVGVFAGVTAGVLSFFLYKVGVFLCGASLGVVVALVLNMAVLYKLPGGNVPFIVAAVALGLLFGGLSYRFMRLTMVLATSIVGAYAFIRSLGFFCGSYPSNEFDIAAELQAGGVSSLPWQIYAYFAGWAAIVVLGVFVQLRFTARKEKGAGKDRWERAYDESADVADLLRGKRSRRKKGRKSRKGGNGGKKDRRGKDAALLDEEGGADAGAGAVDENWAGEGEEWGAGEGDEEWQQDGGGDEAEAYFGVGAESEAAAPSWGSPTKGLALQPMRKGKGAGPPASIQW